MDRKACSVSWSVARFRHFIANQGAQEYEQIVETLARGEYYPEIHAEARAIFKDRLDKRGVRFDRPLLPN